jgi:hypothetical protein
MELRCFFRVRDLALKRMEKSSKKFELVSKPGLSMVEAEK